MQARDDFEGLHEQKNTIAFIKYLSKFHANLKCHNRVYTLSSDHTY